MMNIILSFFILVISANVKAASFLDVNNTNPKLIAYDVISEPNATFVNDNKRHYTYLNLINDIFRDQSKNTKYAYEGGNYHLAIIDFDISIDNSNRLLKKFFSEKRIEALKLGTIYFISYIKNKIKHLISRYMYKYDFEKNYATDLMNLADDLKTLIYDRFVYEFTHDLIKFRTIPENKKLKERSNQAFEALVQNSSMNIQGYCIKITKDENHIYLSKDFSLYFNITISKYQSNATYDFEFPEYEVVEVGTKALRKL